MFRNRSWFGGAWNKPKNRLSLDQLKYLYSLLEKNSTVSENNRSLLVESLRCIAEILIWGDQHDSLVFDFFLEKNMLSFFLHIMRQKSGGSSYVCVQLLQTLNILFENIRNETSLYYLLSNNHVNSIIVHKFDFSDEDVMGYYILFLKTLSLKLNTHTIHFFYNEHTNDFPLYTEAIKFFNHPESMVRIAVRTITLNVYKVQNASMLRFIRDKTAAPYFSNLVWFIGKHILELDACVRTDVDHQSNQKLSNIVAEHLDHLHYLNDILLLEIQDLNAVLTEHLLHKLFIPLYIFSLTPCPSLSMAVVTQNLAAVLNKVVEFEIPEKNNPRVSPVVGLYLLSLVFLVITHGPLVHSLAWVILNADSAVFTEGAAEILNAYVKRREVVVPGFIKPSESLEKALDTVATATASATSTNSLEENYEPVTKQIFEIEPDAEENSVQKSNITDEEKENLKQLIDSSSSDMLRPFLDVVVSSLDIVENDYLALLSLCLLYSMATNRGVSKEWLIQVLTKNGKSSQTYKSKLMNSLLNILVGFNKPTCRIRLITLELTLELLLSLAKPACGEFCITESQKNTLLMVQCEAMEALKNFYVSEDIFLDLFENEYLEMKKSVLNIEYLCMDSTILLPPTGTPLTGIDFARRLPCGEVEKARRAIRGFFLLRRTCQIFFNETEKVLPLIKIENCVSVDNVLDLNNSDLIACTVIFKDNTKQRRFLVIDTLQLILVEPDVKLLGWGVAKYVGFLQDVEVVGDKDDSRCLHITVHSPVASHNRTNTLSAKFLFDDHIRCMAAKQRLTKGRSKARQKKMSQIAQLLEIPTELVDSPIHAAHRHSSGGVSRISSDHKTIFSNKCRVPGFASALKRDFSPTAGMSRIQIVQLKFLDGIPTENNGRSRPSSSHNSSLSNFTSNNTPKTSTRNPSPPDSSTNHPYNSSNNSPKTRLPSSESIPLDDFQQKSRTSTQHSVSYSPNTSSCSPTPSKSRDKIPLPHSTLQNQSEATLISHLSEITQAKKGDSIRSEETSFMSEEDKKRRRGTIEII